jgi:hypothetical protein
MAHTIKVIILGFALLAVCLMAGRMIGGASDSAVVARSALVFVALWFVGSGINMWLGVSRAGYSVADEAPIFLLVFLIPAAPALFVWWRFSRR